MLDLKRVCGSVKSIDVFRQDIVVWDKKRKIYVPQPTRFWILDRDIRAKISRLEEKGYIACFSEKISTDESLFSFFITLHEREIEERIKIFKEKYPQFLDDPRFSVLLDKNVGIGGIRDFKEKPFKVKCLHLWTAYHSGDKRFENPIGEFVLKNI
ncbi:DUF501 domain-containing protein [Persephonella marina]|uniref:DUF501 domain-containing protein n=1 Tax=Persephonella marina TaxID=309805 RepID=UPI001EE66434|nr:DUF501 domain-containing protein [Persephonella marina]